MSRLVLALTVLVLALAVAAPARAAPEVTATCTTPPSVAAVSCSNWFRSNVLVHWNVSPGATPCDDRLITDDTSGTRVTCTASDADGSTMGEVVIKRDATPPDVGVGEAARGADDNGWYTRPVAIAFSGTDPLSGMPADGGCSPVTYDGPDTSAASVVGTCTDVAGNAASRAFPFRFDATAPAVTGLRAVAGDRRVA